MIGLMLVYIDVLFTCGECGFNFLGSQSYSKEWVWNLGEKVCQQGDTLGIQSVLGQYNLPEICGLMVTTAEFTHGGSSVFTGWAEYTLAFQF